MGIRFFVEVTPIGTDATQSYCVEAESWQKALRAARLLRKDDGPISGFSIELADDGCRAVDPMSRLRYVVRRAPPDAVLTFNSAGAAAAAAAATSAPPPIGAQPGAQPGAPTGAQPGAQSRTGSAARASGVSARSSTMAGVAPAASAPPPAAPGQPPRTNSTAAQRASAVGGLKAPPQIASQAAVAATATARPKPDAAVSALVGALKGAGGSAPARTVSGPAQPAAAAAAAPAVLPDAAPAPFSQGAPSSPIPADLVVVSRREQEPTAEKPLYYREEMYALPGITEQEAERVLRAQLAIIQESLRHRRNAKFVNLAVFDRPFQGRPPGPPVATLAWKDWTGAPTVGFPRRGAGAASAPVSAHRPAAAAAAPTPAPAAPSAPPRPISVPPRARTPSDAPPNSSAPASIAALGQALSRVSAPMAATPAPGKVSAQSGGTSPLLPAVQEPVSIPVSISSTPPPAAVAPVVVPPAAPAPSFVQPAPVVVQPPPSPAAVAAQPTFAQVTPSAPPPATPAPGSQPPRRDSWRLRAASGAVARVGGDELIAVLFEQMHDLHFARDSIEGADFCLGLLLEKLPSRGGLVHFYDMDKREFVVASVTGASSDKLLLRRHPTTDPLLTAALRRRGAIVINDAATNDAAFVERFEVMGGARAIIACPIMVGTRLLGAVEIFNPLDGGVYNDDEGFAVHYVTEQLAEFVMSHGLVLDPARIQRTRGPMSSSIIQQ